MSDGWAESARAWIADMGEKGDFGRACVLDRPMLERVGDGRFATALDVGCGEGRFCRMLAERGIRTVGIDPTEELLRQARHRDPKGDYRIGRAESLEFPDFSFDLVVTYLSLIDIGDIARAIAEMATREHWKIEELHTEEGRLDEVFRSITQPETKLRDGQ